ncbi:MAG: metallophosphoesterase [archaeon]|nr:metallophosphoesterase [archaeon]
MKPNYTFIQKSLFFPEYGILAVGDLHLGYEHAMRQSGVLIPETQIKEVINDLKVIFHEIKTKNLKLKKIVFIGDIKHSFNYEYQEKNYFRKIMDFLKQNIKEKNIIFIKGNHDTIDFSYVQNANFGAPKNPTNKTQGFSGGKMKKDYTCKDIAFIHGDKSFKEIFDKKIKTIVLGHIHPSVILRDKQNIKREKYKCFLVGKFKSKETIILPSFLNIIEGSPVNSYKDNYKDYFSIIPKITLENFKVFVIGNDKTYEFGKVKKLK